MQVKVRESKDERGVLVSTHFPGFTVKNIYWVTGAEGERGGHAHKKIRQILFCVKGRITFTLKQEGEEEQKITIKENEYIFLDTFIFAWMEFSSKDDILLGLCDAPHDTNDYIYQK